MSEELNEEDVVAMLRGDDRPSRFFIFPGMLRQFDFSLLDGAVLWLVIEHTNKSGFYGIPNRVAAQFFNVDAQSIANSVKTLTTGKRGVLPLITKVKIKKEKHLEYLKSYYEIPTKRKENGMLKAQCYVPTETLVAYIKPWAGKK